MKPTLIDKTLMGSEPDFSEPITNPNDIRLAKAFTWYNYYGDYETSQKWVIEYLQSINHPLVETYTKTKPYNTPIVIGSIARLLSRKIDIPNEYKNKIIINVEKAIKYEDSCSNRSENLPRSRNKLIEHIETIFDRFFSQYNIDPTIERGMFIFNEQIPRKNIQEAINYYTPLFEEISNYEDPQIQEGYSHLSKENRISYQNFVKNIIDTLQTTLGNTPKVQRKPRKKKQKSPHVMVKKAKFLAEYKELGLKSVSPETIIGANSCWFYNTKYKKVTRLVADSPQGLSMKGTTIIAFSDTESTAKIVRKPKEFLARVSGANKVALRHLLSELKTKELPVNGRLGKDTIILRTIR